MRPCSTPAAPSSATSVAVRCFAPAEHAHQTVACARSDVVSHARHCDEADPRIFELGNRLGDDRLIASLTRPPPGGQSSRHARSRSMGQQLEALAAEPALGLVEEPARLTRLAGDAGERKSRALPDLVVVDLGDRARRHGSATAPSPSGDHPFLLERVALGEEELERVDADVAAAHGGIEAGTRPSCDRRPAGTPGLAATVPGMRQIGRVCGALVAAACVLVLRTPRAHRARERDARCCTTATRSRSAPVCSCPTISAGGRSASRRASACTPTPGPARLRRSPSHTSW